MSKLNGDKARFRRLRKAGLLRRERARQAWTAIRRRLGPMEDAVKVEVKAGSAEAETTLHEG